MTNWTALLVIVRLGLLVVSVRQTLLSVCLIHVKMVALALKMLDQRDTLVDVKQDFKVKFWILRLLTKGSLVEVN